jgi:hypothetical protein
MNNYTWLPRPFTRIATAILTVAATVFAMPLAGYAQGVTPPAVPPGLEVLDGSQVFLIGRGVGTQNYECQPTDVLGHVAWVLFTPEATLFDDAHNQLTTHFFSPNPAEGQVVRATWQDSQDTSTVWAKAIATATVDPNAIAWVLLQVVGRQAGPTGGTTLSGATFIQRVNTVGGLAPTTGCNNPVDVGHKAFQRYTADYVFYSK